MANNIDDSEYSNKSGLLRWLMAIVRRPGADAYAQHEFDAHRRYRKDGPDRRQIVYWPEIDRRVEKAERRSDDRVIREKKS